MGSTASSIAASLHAEHDESRVREILILVSTLTILAIIFVLLRFYIRYFKHKGGLWWDDWLILLSLGLSVGMAVTQIVQLKYGFGQHLKDLPPGTDFKTSVKIFYYHQIMYLAICGTVKLSILVFCLRLSRALRPAVYFGIAFVSCSTLAVCLVDVFQCSPINFDWDQMIKGGGHCINRTPFYFACAAINIVSDIYVYVLPMKTLWKIQLPRKQRIGILLVFAVGFFVVLAGFLRLHSLWKVSVTEDPTYDNAIVTLWSHTEFNIAIICACLPSLKILLKKVLGIVKNVRSTGAGGEPLSSNANTAGLSPRSPMFPYSPSTSMGMGYEADDDSLIHDRDLEKKPVSRGCNTATSTVAGADWEEDARNRSCNCRTEIIGHCEDPRHSKTTHEMMQMGVVKTTNVDVQIEDSSTASPSPPPGISVAIAVPISPMSPTFYSGGSGERKADEVLGIARPESMARVDRAVLH